MERKEQQATYISFPKTKQNKTKQLTKQTTPIKPMLLLLLLLLCYFTK